MTLNWGDVGNPNSANPTIDIFQAADVDGGTGYQTNETIATAQINAFQSRYVGRLGPGQSLRLNSSQLNGWAGNHFIWCGVNNGSGQLNLTITDGNGNVLAQASQWIQIVDIKQMYERWTVGFFGTSSLFQISKGAVVPSGVPMKRHFPASRQERVAVFLEAQQARGVAPV